MASDNDGYRSEPPEWRFGPAGPERIAYSPKEFARLLGLSRGTIERAIRAGTMPSTKIRNRRLIPRQYLDEIVARAYAKLRG
jgi:excisionase family DNA binding protein